MGCNITEELNPPAMKSTAQLICQADLFYLCSFFNIADEMCDSLVETTLAFASIQFQLPAHSVISSQYFTVGRNPRARSLRLAPRMLCMPRSLRLHASVPQPGIS